MDRISVRFARAALCGLILSCLASTASGQFKASIQGTVTDQSGAVAPGVKVTVTNQETGKHQNTVTSSEGFYRITELPPGTYTITAETQYFGGALDDSSNGAFIRAGGNFPGGGAKFFNTTTVGPPGIGRNSFRGPKYNDIDLSLVKQTRFGKIRGLGDGTALEVRGNLFNAFNQLNLQPIGFFDPGAIITGPNFGRSSAGPAGRVIELQARFSF